MKTFKEFIGEAAEVRDTPRSGDTVEIVSGINAKRTGTLIRFFDDPEGERCLVDLRSNDDFETRVSNVRTIGRHDPSSKPKKVCKANG